MFLIFLNLQYFFKNYICLLVFYHSFYLVYICVLFLYCVFICLAARCGKNKARVFMSSTLLDIGKEMSCKESASSDDWSEPGCSRQLYQLFNVRGCSRKQYVCWLSPDRCILLKLYTWVRHPLTGNQLSLPDGMKQKNFNKKRTKNLPMSVKKAWSSPVICEGSPVGKWETSRFVPVFPGPIPRMYEPRHIVHNVM